ncbi:Uncharacterised protein [Mycobacteroides abscessus subsp. abscessus]|nr:Uncharacterised protein [Mycobacteroides abscessus subsp. abscessus]
MRSEPLISPARRVSVLVAFTPGYRSPMVDSSTPVSPSEGSTWPM